MKIVVRNLRSNETVPHSLVLLIGEIIPHSCNCANSINVSVISTEIYSVGEWPVIRGHFRAFASLRKGNNIIKLQYCETILKFTVQYKPITCNYFIRPVYIICEDDTGTFQAAEGVDNSVRSAQDRIILGSQMIQLFTAENLNDQGFGRKTFRLELGEDDLPICQIFKSSLKRKEAQALSPTELWKHFGCELMNSDLPDKTKCKFFAFLSFTEYKNHSLVLPKDHNEVLSLTKGHTALGGGGLALFGTGCLHTWARNVAEILPCFSNVSCIDKLQFMDDSAGRGQYWANYSTTLGAACHELGHTFDLGHNPKGIMARGFDDIYSFFVDPTILSFSVNNLGWCKIHNCSSSQNSKWFMGEGESKDSRNNNGDNNNRISQGNSKYQLCVTTDTISPALDVSVSIASSADENVKFSKPSVESFSCNEVFNLPQKKIQFTANKYVTTSIHQATNNQHGASWYRSSAILLRYHKWFNEMSPKNDFRGPVLDRMKMTSNHGLRIIEFRSEEGMTIHFWEFLEGYGKSVFQINLNEISKAKIEGRSTLKVVAEDSYGNILNEILVLKPDDINFK